MAVVSAMVIAGCEQPRPSKSLSSVAKTYQEPPEPTKPDYFDISIPAQAHRIPVIMYHDAIPERKRDSEWFDVSRDEFDAQMKLIQEKGLVPISVRDFYEDLIGKKDAPAGAIVLTFDDNYQGFYDVALPILRQYNFPAMMFVHTGFVGRKEGKHPKMSWDTLKEIIKDPLISIGSHTVSHPDDITTLTSSDQQDELVNSKAELEKQLGIPIDFFAYPDGKNDEAVQALSKATGYKLAFTIVNGPAEESPNIFAVNRYVHTRLEKAIDDCQRSVDGGALGVFSGPVSNGPVTYREVSDTGVKVALVEGGKPETVTSDTREGVLDFVHRTGAVAGINGTFFSMAAIASTDNKLIGPCKTPDMALVVPDLEQQRWEKLLNRPIIMWGPTALSIFPFVPASMANDEVFKAFMPDVTDVFMGGAWMVHGGIPRTREQMDTFASKDINDARRRAFIGLSSDGKIVLGASKESCSTEQLANAAAAAGVAEAVLLDSGFSTSLVYGEKIMASGHSTASQPSRPVPHAIVLKGTLDPASVELVHSIAPSSIETGRDDKPRRKRRRRRKAKASAAPKTSTAAPTTATSPYALEENPR